MIKPKTVRIIFWIFLIGIVVSASAIYYVFNKPRRNISNETAAYTLEAKQLIADFKKDESSATTKYLDQAITVKGEIKSIRSLENHSMVFSLEDEMEGVSCTVDSADIKKYATKLTQLTKGSTGVFKGRCSGMLMDIQIINAIPE